MVCRGPIQKQIFVQMVCWGPIRKQTKRSLRQCPKKQMPTSISQVTEQEPNDWHLVSGIRYYEPAACRQPARNDDDIEVLVRQDEQMKLMAIQWPLIDRLISNVN